MEDAIRSFTHQGDWGSTVEVVYFFFFFNFSGSFHTIHPTESWDHELRGGETESRPWPWRGETKSKSETETELKRKERRLRSDQRSMGNDIMPGSDYHLKHALALHTYCKIAFYHAGIGYSSVNWIQFVLSGFSVPISTDFSHLCEGHCPLQSDIIWVLDGDNNVRIWLRLFGESFSECSHWSLPIVNISHPLVCGSQQIWIYCLHYWFHHEQFQKVPFKTRQRKIFDYQGGILNWQHPSIYPSIH